ncbi:Nnf1-domain-containing protein [Stipitochalara longipes BDJ]|nr:Nnf1-domain-containing protein [Stipitochalara longipes BDJ]
MPSADPSKSPSPPPQPPTALTPGPRANAFRDLYTRTLDSTLKAISPNSFSACFPSIATNAPTQLAAMHKGMSERLRSFALSEFETILEERKVVERLNALEDLIADARKRRARALDTEGGEGEIVVPHMLPPKRLVNAQLDPLYRSQQSQLNAKLQTTQSQNASLVQVLRSQKAEIEDLMKMVEKLVGDAGQAGEQLGAVGEEVAGEGRRAEGVLGSV